MIQQINQRVSPNKANKLLETLWRRYYLFNGHVPSYFHIHSQLLLFQSHSDNCFHELLTVITILLIFPSFLSVKQQVQNSKLSINKHPQNQPPANLNQLNTIYTKYLNDLYRVIYCRIDGDLHYRNNKIWKLYGEDFSLMVTFQCKKLNKQS